MSWGERDHGGNVKRRLDGHLKLRLERKLEITARDSGLCPVMNEGTINIFECKSNDKTEFSILRSRLIVALR